MAEDTSPPLVGPFCEECFEGETLGPEHELPLVPFEKLAAARGRDLPADDDPIHAHVMRYGRLPLLVGALTVLAGFFLPLVETVFADGTSSRASGMATASNVALNLWIVPAVAATTLSILGRRRTLRQMRGSRLALVLLALVAGSSLGYTVSRVFRGATQLTEAYGQEIQVHLLAGLWVMGAGLLVIAAAAPLFGRVRDPGPRYAVR